MAGRLGWAEYPGSMGRNNRAAWSEEQAPMTDIKKARLLFCDAGLAFPTIPDELAAQLKERDRWVFSTRPIDMSPYNLEYYVDEIEGTRVKDYAVVSHSGHGVNSYAIQYYLVHGSLHMFLHLAWGGVYMDVRETATRISDCFSIADLVVTGAQSANKFQVGERLKIVGSDFYGSYWLPPGNDRRVEAEGREGPLAVLTQALAWLTIGKRAAKSTTRATKKR